MKTELFGTLIMECKNYPQLKRKILLITEYEGKKLIESQF